LKSSRFYRPNFYAYKDINSALRSYLIEFVRDETDDDSAAMGGILGNPSNQAMSSQIKSNQAKPNLAKSS
jgi:hypothetical protein